MPGGWRRTVPLDSLSSDERSKLTEDDLISEVGSELVCLERLHPIDEAILSYLNAYDQPQSMAAICQAIGMYGIRFLTREGLDSDGSVAVLRRLEKLAADGRVEKVVDGVEADGSDRIEWAPRPRSQDPVATRETRS